MDSLSEVSTYLNELENMLDDGDSPMKVEELVEEGTEMERIEAMDVNENVLEKDNYMSEDMLNTLGYVRLDYGDYGRKMARKFELGSMGEMRIDVTMLKEDKDDDSLLENLLEIMIEVEGTSGELVKMRLGNPRPYHSNLTMADNTQAKAMGEVRNVRIQIGYQAYLSEISWS
ncbi:hypothetical protein Tco_1123676 [Tanacetum coccineum]|uniref:Uncharacterized protein n=1 Tax=Tanacetum coccineum TaxID=301880 RepID=A0ABQ5J4K6_9ASTR